jgi:hypothetical protein
MINENLAALFGMPEITVITDYSITEDIVKKCYETELNHFKDSAVDLQTYLNKMCGLPDFDIVFMHKETKAVIGYFIILPLTNDAVMRFFSNELTYETIQPSDLTGFPQDGLYNLYFDSKALEKQYQTAEMARLVFTIIVDTILNKARKFSLCNFILIDQYREFTKVIAESMNAKYIKKQKYKSGLEANLYACTFDYKRYAHLPNYLALEFAYNNTHSKKILEKRVDLLTEIDKLDF